MTELTHQSTVPNKTRQQASIVEGSAWMIAISLLLFFLPAVNGLIAGVAGGWRVGTVKGGLKAAILPAIVVSIGLWLMLIVFQLPFIGFLVGLAAGTWIAVSNLGLFVGAAVGGWLGSQ